MPNAFCAKVGSTQSRLHVGTILLCSSSACAKEQQLTLYVQLNTAVKLLHHFHHENIIGLRDLIPPPDKTPFEDIYIGEPTPL